MKFTKMHGLGNDYVYVNCFEEEVKVPEKLAPKISARHFGVGADGLILICPSDKADVRMRVFNADGSEAEMCGNGIRCVAKYAYEHKLAKAGGEFEVPGAESMPASIKVETAKGVLRLGLEIDDDRVKKVCVNMGEPILDPKDIPVNIPAKRIVNQPMQFQSRAYTMTCVSMGNPHAVFFREDIYNIELEKVGPVIEHHSIFPKRVNVHFVKVQGPNEFYVRSWERGSGITLACGTGACACCVAGVLAGKTERICACHLPGGELELNWSKADNCVYMTGPAEVVFEGDWPDK